MTILSMLQQVCPRIGIAKPTAVASSQDPQLIQLLALANEEGQELSARYPWQVLQKESTFTTLAAETQGTITTLAGAGFRYILNDVMWNRTLLRPVFGALNPQEWQALKARNVTGPYNQYRMRGNSLLFIPAPVVGQTIAFEWITKYWATGAGGDASTWAADADTAYLDEEIMTSGILWRWKAAKGLEFAEDFNKYEGLVVDQMARDGGKSRISLEGGINNGYAAGVFVSAGSWPL